MRGLHIQEWDKYVYPANGEIFVALVDMRVNSPSYLKRDEFNMSDANRGPIFIPKGVANSWVVIGKKPVDYFYYNFKNYNEDKTKSINWQSFAIKWPIKNPIISLKDKNAPMFKKEDRVNIFSRFK